MTSSSRPAAKARPLLAALAVLLLAAALRIGGAGTLGAWSDEGWNLWIAREPGLLLARLADNHHPPAYFASLSAWRAVAGESRLALRWLSVAAGLLCVALIYRAGADAFGRGAGLAAALLFAVFEQPVYYGQTMRHYAFLALGVCLSLCLFLRILRHTDAQRPPSAPLLIGYACGVALTLYSMYLGALALLMQGVVGLLLWRAPLHHKLRLVAAWAGAGALLTPWLLYALPGQWGKVERGVITGYHNTFTTTPGDIATMLDLLLGGQPALGLALLALATWHARGLRPAQRTAAVTVLLSGVGVFALMLLLNLRVGILAERTLFFLLPGLLLTLGLGLRAIPHPARGLLLAGLVGWALLTPQGVVPRINADQAARTVAAGYTPGDLVLLETGFDDAVFSYEMALALGADAPVFRSFWEYDHPSDDAMLTALNTALNDDAPRAPARVWLVYWNVPLRFPDLLTTHGFSMQAQWWLPTGVNDPLYDAYPLISVMLFARPDLTGAPRVFSDLFALRDARIPPQARPGALLHIDLWWAALRPPERDYSIGVFLLDADGVTRLEHFGPSSPTSGWPLRTPVFDRHTLALPPDLPPGAYSIAVNAYWYQTAEAPLLVDGAPYAVVGTLSVH